MARSSAPGAVVALLAFTLGCGARSEGDTIRLRIGAGAQQLSAAAIRYEPKDNLRSARLGTSSWLAIERRNAARPLTVTVPEYCPLTIPAGSQRAEHWLAPIVDLGGDRPPLGFDARFAISVAHGCPERGRGRISWRQIAGTPLRGLAIERDGFSLTARTPSLEQLHPEPRPEGIVPFSPRTQGRAVLEATWSGPLAAKIVRSVAIPATSRASGVASVAVSQQLVLSDASYRVKGAPPGGHARPVPSGAVTLFTPDAPGRWLLERAAGPTLTLHAFWHDKTPYDCGRSECHAQIAADTLHSPMSHALERRLTGPPAAVSCTLDCHVLGERGLHDGGFLDVAAQLGFTRFDALHWQDLPQVLRRLGAVRCTACHGPGAIPPPDGRAAILSSDVCATCHDAPPRYVHVQEWRASRMARSDSAPSTREGACASCHTTSGFLAASGARSASLQPSAAGTGIACAACHAPHASQRGPRLLRSLPDDPAAEARLDPASALCARCHAPGAGQLQPSATAAPLYLGMARVPAARTAGWELVRGPSPHAAVPRGCIGCHGARATPDAGLDHSFRVDMGRCVGCHEDAGVERLRGAQRELEQHARRLLRELGAHCSVSDAHPLHAHGAPPTCTARRYERALYEVSLVLEDPAAGLHNAGFARELLRDAEQQLAGGSEEQQ